MKIFLVLLVEILLALLFMLFVSQNYNSMFEYTCPFDKHLYSVSYVHFATVIYLIGALTTIILYAIFSYAETRALKAYKKEHEKSEISHAEKDNKIISLENKVKTLETALDNVLKKNDSEQN